MLNADLVSHSGSRCTYAAAAIVPLCLRYGRVIPVKTGIHEDVVPWAARRGGSISAAVLHRSLGGPQLQLRGYVISFSPKFYTRMHGLAKHFDNQVRGTALL